MNTWQMKWRWRMPAKNKLTVALEDSEKENLTNVTETEQTENGTHYTPPFKARQKASISVF